MQNVIIFGPPGSGKGTQSEKIIEKYGFAHISTGEILRAEMKSNTQLGKTAATFIDKGQLVPDDLIIDILENKLNTFENIPGVIFDGFPRTVEQAKALKIMLAKRHEKINVMINLEVDKPEIIDRLLKRGQISGRSDDNLETIQKRIKVYDNQTTPVIDFYKNEGCYQGINGVGSIDEIFSSISESIETMCNLQPFKQ